MKAGIQGREGTSDDEGVLCGWTDVHQAVSSIAGGGLPLAFGVGRGRPCADTGVPIVGPEVLPS